MIDVQLLDGALLALLIVVGAAIALSLAMITAPAQPAPLAATSRCLTTGVITLGQPGADLARIWQSRAWAYSHRTACS